VQIQINTDNNLDGDQEMKAEVHETVSHRLERFAERLTRVEVHLSDVNAHKGGLDIRCVIEARPSGMQPVIAEELAEDVPKATRGAADKLVRALDTRFGKRGR
jgi:ribosome-associated translation inhibitor RaiA